MFDELILTFKSMVSNSTNLLRLYAAAIYLWVCRMFYQSSDCFTRYKTGEPRPSTRDSSTNKQEPGKYTVLELKSITMLPE